MQVQGSFQRFVSEHVVGAHFLSFTVTDSKGKELMVSFNLSKGLWNCPCAHYFYRQNTGPDCGHIAECKRFVGFHPELKRLVGDNYEAEKRPGVTGNNGAAITTIREGRMKGVHDSPSECSPTASHHALKWRGYPQQSYRELEGPKK